MLREFGWQAIEFPSRRRTSIVVLRLNSRNFPVYSRKTGKRRNRDEFADDCPHRHPTNLAGEHLLCLQLDGLACASPSGRRRRREVEQTKARRYCLCQERWGVCPGGKLRDNP